MWTEFLKKICAKVMLAMMQKRVIRKTFTPECRLRSYQTSDLVFSCIRSRVAYQDPVDIVKSFENKRNLVTLCDTEKACNLIVRSEVQKRIDRIVHKPLFYDGRIKKRDAQGFMLWDNNRIYVTFRGTADIFDVFDNIDIRRKTIFKNIKVHMGYYEQFASIEEDITRDMKHIMRQYPIKELVFAGHSMASACATICSPYYGEMFKGRYKITTHTLGGAAVGNVDFVSWFCSNVDDNVRIEAEGDIVPYIPIYKDFYHVPNGIKLSKDGKLETQYEVKPYSYFKIMGTILKKDGWKMVNEDHSCENYISSLFAIPEEF